MLSLLLLKLFCFFHSGFCKNTKECINGHELYGHEAVCVMHMCYIIIMIHEIVIGFEGRTVHFIHSPAQLYWLLTFCVSLFKILTVQQID